MNRARVHLHNSAQKLTRNVDRNGTKVKKTERELLWLGTDSQRLISRELKNYPMTAGNSVDYVCAHQTSLSHVQFKKGVSACKCHT